MKKLDANEVPVGSILENNVESSTSTSDKQVVEVRGTGGSVRHTGEFSANNPYLNQMQLASRNQDKDALYELAVKWEADNYATQENREYNSPLEQVSRNRAAGINSDIVGGSSAGGSSAGGSTSAPIPQQSNTTEFSNAYDNIDKGLNIVNTSLGVAQSAYNLTVGFGTLSDTLRQSHNSTTRDNVFTERYPTILDAQGFSLDSANAVKATAIQSKYNSWADIITNFDFADIDNPTSQDIEALFQSLGLFSNGDREEFSNFINNGKAIRKIKEEALARRKAKADFDIFTGDYMQKLVFANAQAKLSKSIAEANYNALDESLSAYLLDREEELTSSRGSSIINESSAEANRSDLSRQRAEFNLERYKLQLQHRQHYMNSLMTMAKSLDLSTNEGRATYQLVNSTRLQLATQFAEELPLMHNLYQRAMQAAFYSASALGTDNQINWTDSTFNEAVNGFYSQLYSGSDAGGFDLFGALTSLVSNLGSVIATKRIPGIK